MKSESNVQPTAKSPRMKNHLKNQKSLKKDASYEVLLKCEGTSNTSACDNTSVNQGLKDKSISLGLSGGESTCRTAPSNNKNSNGDSSSKSA